MTSMYLRNFIILLLALFAGMAAAASAQDTYDIRGIVLEEATGKPLPGVSVYLANTTRGDASDVQGHFHISNIPAGIYNLVISHVAYESFSMVVNTDSLQEFYTIKTDIATSELGELVVTADPEEWENNYGEFLKGFLGYSDFAQQTEILNSEVLQFSFDVDSLVLEAYAHDILTVENRALGYRIQYDLKHFSIHYRLNQTFVAGVPFFVEMEPMNEQQREMWEQNRQRAYQGSFDHFVNSLISGSAAREKFHIRAEKVEDDTRLIGDSLVPLDHIVTRKEDHLLLHFPYRLNVKYMAEREEERYVDLVDRRNNRSPDFQESFFYLTADSLKIDYSGYIYDPLTVIQGLYWSYEKVPYLLPLGYTRIKQPDSNRFP